MAKYSFEFKMEVVQKRFIQSDGIKFRPSLSEKSFTPRLFNS